MAQHDGVLDNAAGAAFRTDLNNFLLAILSNSSGATAPSTTYAYQFWADTTTGLLKQRNAANSAWITIGTLADAYLGLLPLSGGTLTGLLTFKKGADIASAATLNLTAATGNLVHISGTTATSAVTLNSGQVMLCIADGAWPLTYHATNNKINSGGVNVTLAAGDMVLYHSDGTTVRGYIIKADGTAVVGGLDITGLTEDTAPDATADFVPTYDVSATTNKKVKLQEIFGLQAWESKVDDTVYQASTDGFVVAYFATTGGLWGLQGFTDSSNPPTTVRAMTTNRQNINEFSGALMMPVRKNDYWKVADVVGDGAGARTIYWIPATA